MFMKEAHKSPSFDNLPGWELVEREGYVQLDSAGLINEFADVAEHYVQITNTPVVGIFNEIPVVVLPGDTSEMVEKRWNLANHHKSVLYQEFKDEEDR